MFFGPHWPGPRERPMNPAKISHAGNKYAEDWLRRSGYEVKRHTEFPGGVEIEADHPSAKILVHFRFCVFPASLNPLTIDVVTGLKATASQAGRRPYAATVILSAKGELVRDPEWQTLPR